MRENGENGTSKFVVLPLYPYFLTECHTFCPGIKATFSGTDNVEYIYSLSPRLESTGIALVLK